jgi:predicted nucleic acid-binding protein
VTLFVDSNVFLRYIAADHADHSPRAQAFFRRVAAGEESATTSESVVAEIAYVLQSPRQYALTRSRIRELLYPLLTLRGMELPDLPTYLEALDAYALHDIDIEDALSVAHIRRRKLDGIVSFDRDFDGVPDVDRFEPFA